MSRTVCLSLALVQCNPSAVQSECSAVRVQCKYSPSAVQVRIQVACMFMNLFTVARLEDISHESINSFLSNLVERSVLDLEASYCLEIGDDETSLTPTTLGN